MRNNIAQKLFTLLIVLFPIINIYPSNINVSIGLGDIALLIVLIIYAPIILRRKVIVTEYLVFTIYIIGISILNILFIHNGIPISNLIRILRHGFYGTICCFYVPHLFNLSYGKRLIKIFCCLLSIGLLFQVVFYYIFHKIIWFWFPVKTFTDGILRVNVIANFESMANTYLRPQFVFLEPAHFTQYVIIGTVAFLFWEEDKYKSIAGAGLCSLAIVLSTSAAGILMLVACWGLWFLFCCKKAMKRGRIKKYECYIMLIGLLSILCILLFTNLGQRMISRINEIDFNKGSTSGNLRVLRGFIVYSKLDVWRKVIGVGLGNIADYFNKISIELPYIEGNPEYMNSLTYILNSAGLGGAFLFIVFFFKKMRINNPFCVALSCVLLGWSCCESIYNCRTWLIYVSFLLCFQIKMISYKKRKIYALDYK